MNNKLRILGVCNSEIQERIGKPRRRLLQTMEQSKVKMTKIAWTTHDVVEYIRAFAQHPIFYCKRTFKALSDPIERASSLVHLCDNEKPSVLQFFSSFVCIYL